MTHGNHSHPTPIKNITVDVTDPHRMAEFWGFALGYVLQPPPEGFETWEAFADAVNMSEEDRERYSAVIDPHGIGPRILFQKVPEDKAVKNRWHLDIDIVDRSLPEDQHNRNREAKIKTLITRGATEIERFDEPAGKWVLMTDPEGNEFCVL